MTSYMKLVFINAKNVVSNSMLLTWVLVAAVLLGGFLVFPWHLG